MYGIKGTECKIVGCNFPVWPSKTKGFCNRHYRRSKTGRMLATGELVEIKKHFICKCGKEVIATGKAASGKKYCESCRKMEKKQVQIENNSGIYRIGQHCEAANRRAEKKSRHLKERYIRKVLSIMCRDLKKSPTIISRARSSRNYQLIAMRKQGATLKEVGERFGISRQRASQIVQNYDS